MIHSSRVYFWLYSLVLASLASAIWFLGPALYVQQKAVLASPLNRLATIALLLLIAEFIRLQPRHFTAAASFDPKIRAQLSLLKNSLTGALKFLRKTKVGGPSRKEILVRRPWHLLIGPPNSGKTSLMANSGFTFILSRKNAGKSNKPTRHVDWWVTRDAIVLDTSGLFTCQGHQPVYKKLWFTLLHWLKRHAKVAPIQSVMVALSPSDLLKKNEKEQHQVFADIHCRILECQKVLGTGFQLHILFTKCDQFSGFNAFFDVCDNDERDQPWGIVLPSQFQKPFAVHLEEAWQQFLNKLQERTLWRMHQERHLQKRAGIKDFPLQIEKTHHLITALAEHLPPISARAGHDPQALHLTGVFFTSTEQKEAATDHLLEPLSTNFALAPVDENLIVNNERNYFTKDLMSDIIFEGAKIAQVKKQLAFNQGFRYGLYASATFVMVTGTLVLVQSFQNQLEDVDTAKQAMTEYQLLARMAHHEPSLKSLLPALDALDKAQHALKRSPQHVIRDVNRNHQNLPELMQQSYAHTLSTTIVPKLKADLEAELKYMLEQTPLARPDYFYTTLKVYSMLSEPEHANVNSVLSWLQQFWFENNMGDAAQLQQLQPHIAQAFSHTSTRITRDKHLLAQAKLALSHLPTLELAYTLLADRVHGQAGKALTLPIALTESTTHSLHGPLRHIPYLYSRAGLLDGVTQHAHASAHDAIMGDWVMGAKLPPANANARIHELETALTQTYAQRYIKHWQQVLDKTRFYQFTNVGEANKRLKAFSTGTGTSDVARFVEIIKTHTQFNALQAPADTIKTAAKAIHQHFRPVNDRLAHYPEIKLEQMFHQLQQALNIMVRHADQNEASFEFAKAQFQDDTALIEQVEQAIEGLPTPMQAWFTPFTHALWENCLDQAAQYIQHEWQRTIWKTYQKRIANRFPVKASARKSLSIQEFSQFYGPQGKLAEFVAHHIMPFTANEKNSAKPYWVKRAGLSLPLASRSLDVSAQLQRIGQQLFHAKHGQMEIHFSLIASALSPTIQSFVFKIDGSILEYPNGATSLGNVRWPNPRSRRHDVSVLIRTHNDTEKNRKYTGPWALFQFLNQADIKSTDDPKRYLVTINVDKHALKYELVADSDFNPFSQAVFKQLTVPETV